MATTKNIKVTVAPTLSGDTIASYNAYSSIDGLLGTLSVAEAAAGHDVDLSDGATHSITVKVVWTTAGETTTVGSNAVSVTTSAPTTYTDGVFSLDATYLVKSGTNYVCQETSATLAGGYGTTALLVGDFRVRCELESATGGNGENVKSIIGASTTQTRSLIASGGFNIYANALTSLDVRVDGVAVTEDNSTAPVYAAGNYIIVERIGSTFKFIQDVGGTETVVHTATGQTTANLYMWIYSGIVANWVQKPEYLLL